MLDIALEDSLRNIIAEATLDKVAMHDNIGKLKQELGQEMSQ